uniref:Indole diterpene prenyltransferase ltmF n=2 Tax=Epichloe TaxID=5112 RepID=LTMF_EPIFI|nr:RecName: Full=Indole diterpene prenyltransferase ltmF; AltName: Full=Lolitrem B biosynthesis cluster 2 protein F [Epichloe festucae var. lolii]ABF20224.1 aromatic prenyl transferase [Epichloe festucae var. lolii]AGN73079.1 aromatic prenyl transferase [Epichloe hybrida]AVA32104.1 IdtF [Epichloe hybrida]
MIAKNIELNGLDPATRALDILYWKNHCIKQLESLLCATDSYCTADKAAQLRILSELVLPNLGPRPSNATGPSYLTRSGSPIMLSLNTTSSKNCVRYCWEILGATGASNDDPLAVQVAKDVVASLSATFRLSTKWSETLLSNFAVTPDQARQVINMLPEWIQGFVPEGMECDFPKRIPFAMTSFDLNGSNVAMKLYVNPRVKEILTGTPSSDLVWEFLRNLTPEMKPRAVDLLERFITDNSGPSAIELVGIDCVDDAHLSNARVKLYVHTMSSSFNTVKNYVTLGGAIWDEQTQKGLGILQSIWHLLLQEPEGISDNGFDKPVNDSSMLCQKLYFSFELRPGTDFPQVKTYVPTWNYLRTDGETIQNYEAIFRACDHPWGEDRTYGKIFQDAFGPATESRKKPIHCDASFLFTEETGVYQTLYFSPPIEGETEVQSNLVA